LFITNVIVRYSNRLMQIAEPCIAKILWDVSEQIVSIDCKHEHTTYSTCLHANFAVSDWTQNDQQEMFILFIWIFWHFNFAISAFAPLPCKIRYIFVIVDCKHKLHYSTCVHANFWVSNLILNGLGGEASNFNLLIWAISR